MYIGTLKIKENLSFFHAGTDIPFSPDSTENGVYKWGWKTLLDNALDVKAKLEKNSYVGAVEITLPDSSVSKIEILSADKIIGIHSAETGKYTGGNILIPISHNAEEITIRLHGVLENLYFEAPEFYGAYDDGNPLVWPTPKSIDFIGGYKKIKEIVTKSGDADEIFAANFLAERLSESFGFEYSKDGISVVIEKDASYEDERYTVFTEDNKVTVKAKKRLPLLFGCDTLIQLYDKKLGIRLANCDDAPSKEFRGFHLGLPHKSQIEFVKRLCRYVLVPMRFNTLIVEFAGGMRFDSHPEISEAWLKSIENFKAGLQPALPHSEMVSNRSLLEKEDVRDLLDYARSFGIEIVPEVQSWGHVQYITYAHPEIAEIEEKKIEVDDTRAEDARPASFYHHSYCPSLKESLDIIHDLIDEIIEVARPERYVHIGHDEIYQVGLCKRCRTRNPADIYVEHVTHLHDYLLEKGYKTMMWSDMIHPEPVTVYKTAPARTRLPKDILMLDFIWYFENNLPLDIEDDLLKEGYKVAIGNLYSPNFPRYESRMAKDGMIGGQTSTWVIVDEENFADNGKFFDASYLSEMLWNFEGYNSKNRRTYSNIISKLIQPKMRDEIRKKISPLGYKESEISLSVKDSAGVPNDVKAARSASVMANEEIAAPNAYFDKLVFEHSTIFKAPRIAWEDFYVLGEYVISYEDGSAVSAPVRYAANILNYKNLYADPMKHAFYRHQAYVGTWYSDPVYEGKNEYGEDILITGFVFENPTPEKKITRIEYKAKENDFSMLILSGIKGLNAIK